MEVKNKYMQEQLLFENYMSFQMQQQMLMSNASGGGGPLPTPEPTPNPLPSNCIQFVVDTYFGTTYYLDAVSSGPTDYTVDWGDGNTETGYIDGSTSINYTYNDPGSYTVQLCFTDPSLITELDFIGDD
jgi:hypothetical protein